MTATPPPARSRQRAAYIGPQADPAFAAIAAPEIRHRVRVAHAVHRIRTIAQKFVGYPLGKLLLQMWLHDWPGAALIEKKGLPRHSLEARLGGDSLTLHLDPRSLIQFAMHPPGTTRKPSTMAFIWDGDWDLCRVDLRGDYALEFIRDLDTHRDQLEHTQKYRDLIARIEAGKPFQSHQEGVYLNTPERVLAFLRVYLGFLDNMAVNGYETDRAKDNPGVAITREGSIVKVKRGAHRLAMAQWLGLPSIPVEVRYVHREWWDHVIGGARGPEALERLLEGLRSARPEQKLGPLSAGMTAACPDNVWPMQRHGPRSGARMPQKSK